MKKTPHVFLCKNIQKKMIIKAILKDFQAMAPF